MDSMSYRKIALQVGDAIKYGTTVNDIGRAAQSVFKFPFEEFPVDSITSVRARCIFNWIMALAKQSMTSEERNGYLIEFLKIITPPDQFDDIARILDSEGIINIYIERSRMFIEKGFHNLVNQHCKQLFVERHYFHAVFEAAKVYHKEVQSKSHSMKDGQALMMEVWNPNNGSLKITQCISETDKNIQEGIGFLSAGLMRAIRNPTAHEPALDWPINEKDCMDILGFISFLLRKLDDSVYIQ
ncbi:MAG: TIGR02391 family protein [Candidatus Cloacimonadaceae bacterium]|nr:TIGR02391 family protein [Candidatus Cloacimonadaceae bacterium]